MQNPNSPRPTMGLVDRVLMGFAMVALIVGAITLFIALWTLPLNP